MLLNLLRQWLLTPVTYYRLFHNFTRQDFYGQFTASIGGWLWLFVTPIVHIIIYSFVFSYIFQIRALEEFGETRFVIFMMVGYLPWFAFAEAMSRSTGLLVEKAPLITKVMFPVQILPVQPPPAWPDFTFRVAEKQPWRFGSGYHSYGRARGYTLYYDKHGNPKKVYMPENDPGGEHE